MLSNNFLEKVFSHREMQQIPIGAQATAVHALEETLEDILEVNPHVRLSELFTATNKPVSVPV